MDSRDRFLTLGIPWTQSMPSHDVNAATRLAEASWRRDKTVNVVIFAWGEFRENVGKTFHVRFIFTILLLFPS